MNAIKKARRLISADPGTPESITLAHLVRALESEEQFELSDLYKLDFDRFELALDILKDWRLDRYYLGKAKLHDLAVQVAEMDK